MAPNIYGDCLPRDLIIFGSGGHAIGLANVAFFAGYRIRYFVDKVKQTGSVLGIPVVGDLSEISDLAHYSISMGIGDNAVREEEYLQVRNRFPGLGFPALVHPAAIVSICSRIDEGAVLMANAVVGTNSRVGRFCVMSIQSAIGHDCDLADFSSLAPTSVVAGNVRVGMRSAISMAAVVKQGVRIGDDCVLGANSYLNVDLPSNRLAYGSPARLIRSRQRGDGYL